MPQSMQESIRLAREQAQRRRQEMEEQRRQQEEEQRRQQEIQQRQYEEQMRQTAAGQAQQNGLGNINPSTGMNIASKFMSSGAGAGEAGGTAAASTTAGAGSAAGGSGASALGSAGPWGLLAAAIIGNESEARKAGRRDDRKATRAMDMVSGKVLEQDMDYYGKKVGGVGGEIVKGIGRLGNPEGLFNVIKGAFK